MKTYRLTLAILVERKIQPVALPHEKCMAKKDLNEELPRPAEILVVKLHF